MVSIDPNLLFLQAENVRLGLRELARNCHKTPQRLKYTLNQLEKQGIIKSRYTVIDYSYFGLILFRVYFRGGYIGEKDKQVILKELTTNPFVVSIYELSGEYDLIVEFASPNPSRFNKELKKLVSQIPTFKDYKILLNLNTYVCPRQYLTKNEQLQNLFNERIVGGDRERENFTPSEMSVLHQLVLNPRIRLSHLAHATNLNQKTVKSMLKDLTKRNIIKGYKSLIDVNKIGIHKFRFFLKLHNVSVDRESQLLKQILAIKEIVQVNKTVGDWDMELDIESLSRTRLRYLVMQLREEFKDLIERTNLLEFYDYYVKQYLPMYLFENDDQSRSGAKSLSKNSLSQGEK